MHSWENHDNGAFHYWLADTHSRPQLSCSIIYQVHEQLLAIDCLELPWIAIDCCSTISGTGAGTGPVPVTGTGYW